MSNILIRPHFLSVRLNANAFLAFLNNEFYDLLKNISLNMRMISIGWLSFSLWQRCSTLAWYSFSRKMDGSAGFITWPLRSLALIPVHFLYGTLWSKTCMESLLMTFSH